MSEIIVPKKLIEVAVPLDDINLEAASEKNIRSGHPSTLHLWWARRPLAAARAVLFAQMVNEPGWNNPNPTPQQIGMYGNQRKKLFRIMRELVKWKNSDNPHLLKEAREEIWKSWRETCEANKDHPDAATLFNPEVLPAGHDPFAGGGAIPLEMQRLGLTAYASDLNPVAVMINKAMIELPPKCAGHPPVNPGSKKIASSWKGCKGLAEDIQYYGKWMRDEAFKRVGHLYPQVEITEEMTKERPDLLEYVGQKLQVVAWIWARTVKSPSPAYSQMDIPLVKSFTLSAKRNIWVEPVILEDKSGFEFKVRCGGKPKLESTVDNGKIKGGYCILSQSLVDFPYIRSEAQSGRMGEKLMAVVCEGKKKKIYLSPDEMIITDTISSDVPIWKSSLRLEGKAAVNVPLYGFNTFGDLFSKRQALVLSTFSSLIHEVSKKILEDSKDVEYAKIVSTYLSFVLDKCADYWSSVCSWDRSRDGMRNTFGRQAIQMSWDYAEVNPFSNSSGSWMNMLEWVWKVVEKLPASAEGFACQADAQTQTISSNKIISTDPPYYDNIMYADISDFFYVWMRRSLRDLYPELFGSMATPKEEELVAAKHRVGSDKAAAEFFLSGMKTAMQNLASRAHPAYPVTIYYAFKQQSKTKEDGTASTGWETFLEAVIQSGFAITGTLPMRTELKNRMIGLDSNALASSIVLVCRKRDADAPMISRREFIKELNLEMPKALAKMTGETEDEKNEYKVSAVDLAQAALGPGMEIFSKYSGILEANGSKMTVHEALILINRVLSAYLDKDDDEYDADTKFCKAWFELYGWNEGEFGTADTLSRAKGTSVDGLVEAGVVSAKGGKVKLIHFSEYEDNWDATKDSRIPIWEALHHMVKAHQKGGDFKAASIYAQVESMTSAVNLLATRLYQMCEQKGWAEDARPYNELTAAWQAVSENAGRAALAPARAPGKKKEDGQRTLSGF